MKGWRFLLPLCAVAFASKAPAQGVLLVPDFTGDRVQAYSTFDGSLVNANLIVDPVGTGGHLSSPKCAIDSGRGTIFVSDQVSDGVFEYSYSGAYLGTVAGASVGSPLDNVRGIAVFGSDLYVTNAGTANGAPGNVIVKVSLANPAVWSVFASGGTSYFDVFFRASDVLATDSTTHKVYRYSHAGAALSDFHSGAIRFPQQISDDGAGKVLIAGFSPPSSIYQYDGAGVQLNTWTSGVGPRAAVRLGNGKLFYSNGSGVFTFDTVTNVTTQVGTGNCQYIKFSYTYDVPVVEYVVVQGEELGGGLSSLRASDDVRLDILNNDVTLQGEITFFGSTQVAVPAIYTVRAETVATRPGLSQAISVHNYMTNAWVAVDGRVAPAVDTPVEITLTSNLNNYVSVDGDIAAQIVWSPINDEDPSQDGWLLSVDQFYWTIKP